MTDKEYVYVKEGGVVKKYVVARSFEERKRREPAENEARKREALAQGVEPFDVDEALKYYYPNDLTDNEERIRKAMAALESDYYSSGARTLKEWADEMERYDVIKDSTGTD